MGAENPGLTYPSQDLWSSLGSLHSFFIFLQAGYTLDCIPMGFSLRDPFLNKGRRHHTLEVFFFLKTLRMNGNGSFQKRCQGSLFRIE